MDLEQRIKRLGLKKQAVANQLGVSRITLSHWLHGTREMPLHKKMDLHVILDQLEKTLNDTSQNQ